MQPKVGTDTDNNAEFITLREAKTYISRMGLDVPPDVYFQYIVRGWMKFVAPLTSSSVDDIPHLKCNKDASGPLAAIPESVEELMSEMTRVARLNNRLSEAKSFSLLNKAWPTMWIWIQHIYYDHLLMPNRCMDEALSYIHSRQYTLLEVVFTVLVDHDGAPTVAQIIASHPGILNMMANMWIKEGTRTDEDAVHRFYSGRFADPRLALHQGFLAQILLICGSAGEFVHAMCQRIERLLGQLQPNDDVLFVEYSSLTWYMFQEGHQYGPHMIRPVIYASSRVVAMWMQAWAHVVSASSVKYRDGYLIVYMKCIAILVESSAQAYDRVLTILDHGLFSLFIKSVPLVHSSSANYEDFTNIAVEVLDNIICPATIHREILHRCARASCGQENFLPPTSNPRVHVSWSRLLKLLDKRQNGYKIYKARSRPVLLCGNPKCDNVENLRRCSACRISLYCSGECQSEKWVSHKMLCNSMKGKVHSCVDLSYPNLHYLSYLVASDMKEVMHLKYTLVWDACAKLPGSVPFFFLNYDKFSQGAASIEVMDANDKKPWFPFPDNDNLYQEWRQFLVVSKEQVQSLVVAIPRGPKGAFQMMTAAVVLTDGGAGQSPTIGLRWLHCQ